MQSVVDFYFDYGSPASYVAYKRLPAIAERAGALINYRPVLLGGVLKSVGNIPPNAVPQKLEWFFSDLARWTRRHDVEFRRNPHFPVVTLNLMRGAIAMRRAGRLITYSDAVFKALWVDGENMADPAVIHRVLGADGFDVEALFAACGETEVKDTLKTETEEAVARGVFGAPTFFIGDEQHFGQDRLDFVEEALLRHRAAA